MMTEVEAANAIKAMVFIAYVALTAWAICASIRHFPPDGRGSMKGGGTFDDMRQRGEAETAVLGCCVVLVPVGLALAGWFWG
jgi:hypothetical protein